MRSSAAMGEAGRAFDLTHIVPLDLVFPFAYTLFVRACDHLAPAPPGSRQEAAGTG